MSSRLSALLAAVAILLVSGALCHLLARDTEELEAAAERVPLVPHDVGAWHGTDETPDDRSFEQTEAKAYWMRRYVNTKTNASVLAILMCGRSGKMAVHTPEICYRGAGYELLDSPALFRVRTPEGDLGQFWTAQFSKKTGHLRLYWAWDAQGPWEAAEAPRWHFRGEPFLYKLYLSHEVNTPTGPAPAADPSAEFLRQFVPVLNRTLFPKMD